GINTGSLNLMFSKIFIKINVPNNAKAKEIVIFNNGDDDVNNISEISTPKLAESNVTAVFGDTNLFLLNCCIIILVILILAPAINILIKRCILLIAITSIY